MTARHADEPRINLSDAARMIGFKDRRTFTHWMREAGVTPIQATYRKQQKLLTSGQVEQVRAYIAQQGGRTRATRADDARMMEASSALDGDMDDVVATINRLIDQLRQDLLVALMVPAEAVTPLQRDRNAVVSPLTPLTSPAALPRRMPATTVTPAAVPSLSSSGSARPRLPTRLRSWREYTRLHQLKESEVRHHVDLDEERGGFPIVFNEAGWAYRHYTVKVAFDARGQAAFHRQFRAHWGGGVCPYCDDDVELDIVDAAATRPDLDAVRVPDDDSDDDA